VEFQINALPNMPAATVYFAFFAVGVLSGTVLTEGKKGWSSDKSKTQK
jgi:hypothetical protein